MNGQNDTAASWRAFAARLADLGDRLHKEAGETKTAQQHGEIDQAMLSMLSLGALYARRMDPDYPEWLPWLGSSFGFGNPCPDFVYHVCRISPRGMYRVEGRGANTLFQDLQVNAGVTGFTEKAKLLTTVTLDSLSRAPDGSVSLILSQERPDGYKGEWVQLPPEPDDLFLMLRQCMYDWTSETDGAFSIERIDQTSRPQKDARNSAARLDEAVSFVERFATSLNAIIDQQKQNTKQVNVVSNITGKFAGAPLLAQQTYCHADIALGPDEALVMEVKVPPSCAYWSVQLMDRFYNALDSMFHQTGLNGNTAKPSADGTMRFVIAHSDPGVANWLDSRGYAEGAVRWRFLRGEEPHIASRIVPFSETAAFSGPNWPRLTKKQRATEMRKRATGAQNRRRW